MNPQDIEQEAARRAYKAGLGVSGWEACLLPEEMLSLLRAYKASNAGLVEALEYCLRQCVASGHIDTEPHMARARAALAAARGREG